MKYSKNNEARGYDGINEEFIKYAPTVLHYRFLDLIINICWRNGHVLDLYTTRSSMKERENCKNYFICCIHIVSQNYFKKNMCNK
jgi:hypothetical protein